MRRLARSGSTVRTISSAARSVRFIQPDQMCGRSRTTVGTPAWAMSITWAKASPTSSLVAQLVAVDEQGHETVLGEYTFHHTRTIPTPPGWVEP